MIKNAKIFNGRTMTMNSGDKVRVLTTPHHINRSEIPDDLDIIMGKTDVIGNPSRSCFDDPLRPHYTYTPDLGINVGNLPMYDPSVGFQL